MRQKIRDILDGREPEKAPARPEYYHNRRNAFKEKGLCTCGNQRFEDQTRCKQCIDTHKRHRDRLRAETIKIYGGKCQCPGKCRVSNPKFLAFDHINNDGKDHRKEYSVIESIQRIRLGCCVITATWQDKHTGGAHMKKEK